MPPMLATPTTTYHYDPVQPCFFLAGEEDFYPPPSSQLLPVPGEDIWKKFELLPTPPLSPSRTPPPSDPSPSAADRLEALSELLDEDRNPSAAFLQSFIIQDCMWSSSFAAATQLEQAVSERLAGLRARQNPSESRGADPQPNPGYLQDLQAAASDCIDPSEVFLYAAPGGAAMEAGSEPSLETPPLSSSDSESEEDEDVDVMTVEMQTTSRRPDASPLVLKRSHIDVQQHNYAAPRPPGKRAATVGRSDGEDEDRRRTHNVLERQRRSELRVSFLALRDQVPALAHNHKAAKVLILKRATEFIREVRGDERRLLRKKEELTKRSRELRRRLERLRTLC